MSGNSRLEAMEKFSIENTLFFFCDMQEKFRPTISHFAEILRINQRMLAAGAILDIPMVATEQYPKGLGKTVPELDFTEAGVDVFEKTKLSMSIESVQKLLVEKHSNRKNIVLLGIEAHACVLQTTFDFLRRNYNVHLVADGISSRNPVDRMFAFKQAEKAGAILTTSECVLFSLLKDAKHPKFKEVQKLLMEVPPDSGLLNSRL